MACVGTKEGLCAEHGLENLLYAPSLVHPMMACFNNGTPEGYSAACATLECLLGKYSKPFGARFHIKFFQTNAKCNNPSTTNKCVIRLASVKPPNFSASIRPKTCSPGADDKVEKILDRNT